MLYSAYMPTGILSSSGGINMKAVLQGKDVFQRAEITINRMKTLIGEVPEEEIISTMGHLAKRYYNRYKNELTEKEMIIYDAILREDLKQETIYEWLLAARVKPPDRLLYRKGKISQKKATSLGRVEFMRLRAKKSLEFISRA